MDKPAVKAYVLKSGDVLSTNYLQQYAVKQSKQIPEDVFGSEYGETGIIAPLYHPEALAKLMEMNTYHYRTVKTKTRDTVGLGWNLVPTSEKPNETQKEKVLSFLQSSHPEETLEEILTKWMEDYEATGLRADKQFIFLLKKER
ncbi:hypothetical protein MK805_03050 [Shimazuella sp. AN120528]|uniref:hypothetical protein n=1 Tax=Shimazuella soli TaxID=1892854 RepID=UPI001F0D075C|nr:hypothetical protein [Shimazuella soli]MCH5583940.1 hypothetical protein [Shimazuella soli]